MGKGRLPANGPSQECEQVMKIVVSILLVFITAGVTLGQCNLRTRTTYQSYSVPTTQKAQILYYHSDGYYYQYKGGERGPLYYYSSGHYYPYEDYKYKETVILVPKAIQVEVQRDHYYSINQSARDDLLADAIVGRLLRLQQSQQGQPKSDRVTPVNQGSAPKGPKVKDLGDDRAGQYQDPAMVKIVADSCAKCHGVASKYTKFLTTDGKLPDLPAGKVWEAFGLVNSGEMPKGGKSLGDEDVKKFYEWAKNARKE
jgi:mono/diheme cytochrome c family protein